MKLRGNNVFTTLRVEGSILPPDLLQRIAEGDKDLDGLTPASYYLLEGEKLNEAINRSWNRLRGAWASFKGAVAKLPAKDVGTTVTRDRFLLPLFQELGYGRLVAAKALEIDGKSYPISHNWQHTPIHLVGCGVDLDKRTAGVAGAARSSPHSLVQELLNRSDEYLWAFVSNGLQLRILRDNVSLTRQAYVEFDLEAMMNGEVYADFVLLWLLCHQSRVEAEKPEGCWLEKWSRTAQEQGTRALNQLRDGVEDAIASLGRGFLVHPANRELRNKLQSGELATQDYYRQLLRLVYRLLFLFVAEERGVLLLPDADSTAKDRYTRFYSTAKLRQLAERRRGTRHSDLFYGLRLVMEKLDSEAGCPELGLPALGSFLFSLAAIADLSGCQIANQDLLEAIRSLAFITDKHGRRSVDYKNLRSEELGSVYEALLELHPVLNISAGTFELQTAGGNERKTTGSYYTPESLVQCLLDSALDPVVDEAIKQPDPEAAILNLKICDPACGSGHFLIAAAHRMAKRLAAIRTGEEEPSPDATRKALRDVIGRCIYGVDINPMAVELCKVALWMEALEPGKPLSFLDHHIQSGNSLLGATPALLRKGIPDEAFNLIEGDDKAVCTKYKKQNKEERKGQLSLFAPNCQPWERLGDLATGMLNLDAIADDSIEEVRRKQKEYETLVKSSPYLFSRFLADAWCAAFVWKKQTSDELPYPITEEVFRQIERNPYNAPDWMHREVERLKEQYKFFHWHLVFPDVFQVPSDGEKAENELAGWSAGFDCVLGNPPWDVIAPEEQEFFALVAPEIITLPTRAKRLKAIEKLERSNPELALAWQEHRRKSLTEALFYHVSGIYPLGGSGNLNSYTLFVEKSRFLLGSGGFLCLIIPSALAFSETTKKLFNDLVDSSSLITLYDFENREQLFPAVHRSMKFCIVVIASGGCKSNSVEFAFFLYQVEHLKDKDRIYSLTSSDLALLNPNSKTAPTFTNGRDARIVLSIYQRLPILRHNEDFDDEISWLAECTRMVDLSYDSDCFEDVDNLLTQGYHQTGDIYLRGNEYFFPVYEAKMTQQYDHRAADVVISDTAKIRAAQQQGLSEIEHLDPNREARSRFWMPEKKAFRSVPDWYEHEYFITYTLVTSPTNQRTCLSCIIPKRPAGHSLRIVYLPNINTLYGSALCGCLNSFALDYVCRQKIGGINLNPVIVYQLPFPSKAQFKSECLWATSLINAKWLAQRILELSYTSWTLQPFAKDCGYNGAPFKWDEERRFLLRCELDAAYFHLYGIERDDVDYIMETFPIVKRKDEKKHREYRTKRMILEIYDAMTEAIRTGKPYQTLLDPPPADPRVAHPSRQSNGIQA